jgi:surface protein
MALLKLNVKNLVDIDGKDSDVDLTHWDVSHASNANRAFSNATAFNQDIGSWDVSKVTDMTQGVIHIVYSHCSAFKHTHCIC